MYRRHPSGPRLQYLQAVVKHAHDAKTRLREESWLEWCHRLNAHTSLRDIWAKLHNFTRERPPPAPSHPDPAGEAERLAAHFALRTSPALLPDDTSRKQRELEGDRTEIITRASTRAANSDLPFTLNELQKATKTSGDTAPGVDCITYSMISHLGERGKLRILDLFNSSWAAGRIPETWKTAIIQPIPKPKDPGAMRPISLLSCLSKTMERMVLNRLKWKAGPLHPSLFAFRSGSSTTDCLLTLLSTLHKGRGIVVFLDLEKAFELASPAVILTRLAIKGVAGKLLLWIQSFLTNRKARVRFQGQLSSSHAHVNGTPQGSIISPYLFNILIEGLFDVPLRNTHLLCYADDLALVCPRRNDFHSISRSLTDIQQKCHELGLKINPAKSKFMTFGSPPPERPLLLANAETEHTNCHQYLGVFLDARLSFKKQVNYLRDRTASRTTALKYLSHKGRGVSVAVRRTFYIHAIRAVIDYSAPCLPVISTTCSRSLEVAQNTCLRLIMSAPPWTPVCTLRCECRVPSLKYRIQALTTTSMAKFFRRRPDDTTTRKLSRTFALPPERPLRKEWAPAAITACNTLGLRDLVRTNPDVLHPDYSAPPPWSPPLVTVNTPSCASPRSAHPEQLRREAAEATHSLASLNPLTYYTDGSVLPDGAAGAAFVCNNTTVSFRINSNVSPFQTELAAILLALRHAAPSTERTILIHTDSLSSIEAISRHSLKDNLSLLSAIYLELQSLQQSNNSVILNWVPGHVGIPGNEEADRAARQAALSEPISFHIVPSLSFLKSQAKAAAGRLEREDLLNQIAEVGSTSHWYFHATALEPLMLPPTLPPHIVSHLHRLRLGFKTFSEITHTDPEPCEHCLDTPHSPLLHYILHCPGTYKLRQLPLQMHGDDSITAAYLIRNNSLDVLLDAISAYTPPR